MRRTTVAGLLLLIPALAVGAQERAVGARRSNTSKLFIELAANGSAISVDELSDGTESGPGLTFRLGYGFTPKVAFTFDVTAASIGGEDSYGLGQSDFGMRFHFAEPARAFVPFLEVGFSVFSAVQRGVLFDEESGEEDVLGDLDISGTGFTVGGGFHYFLNPVWALNAGIKLTKGSFDEVTFQNITVSGLDFNATTSRLNIGVAWFPMKPR